MNVWGFRKTIIISKEKTYIMFVCERKHCTNTPSQTTLNNPKQVQENKLINKMTKKHNFLGCTWLQLILL